MMPQSDQLLEDVYDLINRQDGERNRIECARIALLAAQFRAQQLRQKAMRRAIDKHAAERRALKASTRESGLHTADPGAVASPAQRQGVEGRDQ